MADSAIQWCDKVWNPTVGCTRVSTGCEHCYAESLAPRLAAMGQSVYEGLTKRHKDGSVNWTGEVRCLPERIEIPLAWKKPARVFVNSMSDLFHESVPDSFIASVWAVMCATPHLTYQILTKRPERIARVLGPRGINFYAVERPVPCPQPNIWLGTSVEGPDVKHRIDILREVPAAVRFVSGEPLLADLGPLDLRGIHWFIAGGESGANHRPFDPDWARSIRDQCQRDDVAFFFKQHGGRTPKAGGRELDGRTWDEFPGEER